MVLGRDNSKEVGQMVRSILIPNDGGGDVRLQELAALGDFQEAVDGFLEPVEIPALGLTVWTNEAALRQRAGVNSRATALWWYFCADASDRRFILGDVVLTGANDAEDGADAPEHVVYGLLTPHEFVIQVSPRDNDEWFDTQARFDNIFDAATWCMIVGLSIRPGPAFRITADDRPHASGSHEAHWRGRSW